jgi:hypothetical protein
MHVERSLTEITYVTTERLQNLDNLLSAIRAPGMGRIPVLKYDVLKNSWTRILAVTISTNFEPIQ